MFYADSALLERNGLEYFPHTLWIVVATDNCAPLIAKPLFKKWFLDEWDACLCAKRVYESWSLCPGASALLPWCFTSRNQFIFPFSQGRVVQVFQLHDPHYVARELGWKHPPKQPLRYTSLHVRYHCRARAKKIQKKLKRLENE